MPAFVPPFSQQCRHQSCRLIACQDASSLSWPDMTRGVCDVQIRDGEAAARANEEKKQKEAREAEQKRQSSDQDKLKKLETQYAR